jgi:2',3'-cyclic-nucleotide 2'-phosphodiesterase (5'-nucleotidase family)
MNAIKIDCAVAGNHDFDWSAPHFLKLVAASNYVCHVISIEVYLILLS